MSNETNRSSAPIQLPLWRVLLLKIWPGFHYAPSELPPWSRDAIYADVTVDLSLLDRLRVLLSGRLRVHVQTITENHPGRLETRSGCHPLPPAWLAGLKRKASVAVPAPDVIAPIECHGLDTPERVCFYEQDFYVLSNFSSFSVNIFGHTFPTSEHAYHWVKFLGMNRDLGQAVRKAPSAHEAFKIAERHKAERRPDWDSIKVDVMRKILCAKVDQHEYVRRKLLATGDRELVENSWRDSYWGWGADRKGRNMLGKLWMGIRAELRAGTINQPRFGR